MFASKPPYLPELSFYSHCVRVFCSWSPTVVYISDGPLTAVPFYVKILQLCVMTSMSVKTLAPRCDMMQMEHL